MAVAAPALGPVTRGGRSPGTARAWRRKQRREWRRRHLWFPLEGAIIGALVAVGGRLPIDWMSAFGAVAGRLAGRLAPRAVRNPEVRLRALGWSPEAANATARDVVAAFGRTFAEYAVVHRLWQAGRVAVAGGEHLVAARQSGRPVIFVSGHFANWEVLLVAAAGQGFRIANFYRPQANVAIDVLLQRIRLRSVSGLLRKGHHGVREALAYLRTGGAVGILVDERSGGQVSAPAKAGGPGAPLRIAVRLAEASGAVLLPVHIRRLGGARFMLTCGAPVLPDPIADAAVEASVARSIDRWLADRIAERPQDWAWLSRVDDLPERLR